MKKFVDYLEAVRERTPEEIDRIIGSANNRNLESDKELLRGINDSNFNLIKTSPEFKELLKMSDSEIESLSKEELKKAFLKAVDSSTNGRLLHTLTNL